MNKTNPYSSDYEGTELEYNGTVFSIEKMPNGLNVLVNSTRTVLVSLFTWKLLKYIFKKESEKYFSYTFDHYYLDQVQVLMKIFNPNLDEKKHSNLNNWIIDKGIYYNPERNIIIMIAERIEEEENE